MLIKEFITIIKNSFPKKSFIAIWLEMIMDINAETIVATKDTRRDKYTISIKL